MRLTWRDGVAAVFAVAVGMITLAVTQDWGWPLLADYRAGIVALAVVGVPMCLIGGYRFWDSPAFSQPKLILKDPFLTVAAAAGLVAVGLLVVGLISGTLVPFVGLAGVMGMLWIITTVHHAVEERPGIDVPVADRQRQPVAPSLTACAGVRRAIRPGPGVPHSGDGLVRVALS